MSTPKAEIDDTLHKMVLDILDVANVAQVRGQYKKSMIEINKAQETAHQQIESLIRKTCIAELKDFVIELNEQNPYIPLDGTPRQYVEGKLYKRIKELERKLGK